MRKVYILPNLFTAASLFCGMFAIFSVFGDNPQKACGLILLSAILDVADGAIARLTRSTSFFGLNFDSLADLVAFGAAPAVMAYNAFDGRYGPMAAGLCGLYTVCGALRLARFNVQASKEERKTFVGMPIPGAALTLISLIWVYEANPQIAVWATQFPGRFGANLLSAIMPLVLVLLSYLMVSNIPFVGFKNLPRRQTFELLVVFIVIACILFVLKDHLDVVLAIVMWSYLLVNVILGIFRKTRPRPISPSVSPPPSSPSVAP